MSKMRGKVMQKILVNNKCGFLNLMKINAIKNAEVLARFLVVFVLFFTFMQIMNVMSINYQTNVLCSSSQKVLTNKEILPLW